MQREACAVKLRPLHDDWTGHFKVYRMVGYSLWPWAYLNAAICQWLAGDSRGPPCYTTWGQQARCRVPEYASTVSMGPLHFSERLTCGEGDKTVCHKQAAITT